MKKIIYFVTGSQDLYGPETLIQVDKNSQEVVHYLNEHAKRVEIKFYGTVKNSEMIFNMAKDINNDDQVVGVIIWCHTFSPAKMWIKGLKALQKPMLHFHTQYHEQLPYESIDMNFMNLHQGAHGDREFGHICARLNLHNAVVVGFYKHQRVLDEVFSWVDVALGYDYSAHLRVVRFGDNMREVAVTEGDKVEAQIKFGWQVNTYGVGALVEMIDDVSQDEVDALMQEYQREYTIQSDNIGAIREQAKYEIAMKKFFEKHRINAFTNTFEDLYGMNQLPGLATQRLMAQGYGYGGEGDWKVSAMGAIMYYMASGRMGGTGFMEDYTYDLSSGDEIVLGAHMLEVSPAFAVTKPSIEVHPLSIGGKDDPARLVFDGIEGKGIAVSLVDMGENFKLIIAEIELVKQPKAMPHLPVARIMWRIAPSHAEGAKRWIMEGGAHHTVVSTALTVKDMQSLATMWRIPCVIIN